MGETKIDRRRRYTLSVIREAFFALLAEVGFAKMTVADICRRAEINRGTFYLRYEDKYALLDALIDEALAAAPPLEGVESATLCQRPPADDDYRLLYSDSDAYARVAQRVIERGAEQMVPWVMEKTGLSLKALACAGRAARRIRNHPLCGWGQPALQSRPLAGHLRLFRPQGIRVERAVVAYGPEGLQPVAHEVDVQVPRRVHAEV